MQRNVEGEVFRCQRFGNTRSVLATANVGPVLSGLDDDVVTRVGVRAERKGVDFCGIDFVEVVGDDLLQTRVLVERAGLAEIELVQPVVLFTFTAGDGIEVFFD